MKPRVLDSPSAVFLLLLSLALPSSAHAASETVLYRFTGGVDGGVPDSTLTFDALGNLYGTTSYGGASIFYGTVFKLTPASGGAWKETVLHNFRGGSDGSAPTAGVVFDAAGNLYGTTSDGGLYGYGTVFELTPTSTGWEKHMLHQFKGSANGDGEYPWAGVILDSAGNLYGTTQLGGPSSTTCPAGCGTVFKLIHLSTGWSEEILYAFTGLKGDGAGASTGLILDKAGNIYGTTSEGGSTGNYGTVYQLRHISTGWQERIIFEFTGQQTGESPYAGLTQDATGTLYGTTSYGGSIGYGTVFELTPSSTGWTEQVLYSFSAGADGGFPSGSLLLDSSGNLYGTTSVGGCCADGVVFELISSPTGNWSENVLYSFSGSTNKDGSEPLGGVISDANGNLYGTTSMGGYGPCSGGLGCGVVFQISP
jgi:uncharacterized repeat protein (TIGR03803 family)